MERKENKNIIQIHLMLEVPNGFPITMITLFSLLRHWNICFTLRISDTDRNNQGNQENK